jgi:hypothetical protein
VRAVSGGRHFDQHGQKSRAVGQVRGFEQRPVGTVMLKGKLNPVEVFALVRGAR